MIKVAANRRASGVPTVVILVCILLTIGLAASAKANEVYSYTGNPYNLCTGDYASTNPLTHDACRAAFRLTGSFTTTLSLKQLENLNDFVIPSADIASFSFSDGSGLVINQSNATSASFEMTTNGSGNITSPQGWAIILIASNGEMNTSSCAISECSGAQDFSQTATGYGQGSFENPGQWENGLNTPEPGTGWMVLAVSLCVLPFVLRRVK